MNKHTFQHGRFYKITYHGRINLNPDGNEPITSSGKGEAVWFVGLVWKNKEFFENADTQTKFKLIASNFYEETKQTPHKYAEKILVHNEAFLHKRDKVKTIEPFTLKQFPTLIGTKTTTLFLRLLQNKISVKHFPQGKIV